MQPTVGRSVHYQRGGQTLHAVITRVESLIDFDSLAPDLLISSQADEANYEVWLAVFLHTSTIGSVEFSPTPIPYGTKSGVDKHWSWPPRVA